MTSPFLNHDDQLKKLEEELENQKRRFLETTQQSSEQLQDLAFILKWFRSYPLQAAGVAFGAGFFLSQFITQKTTKTS